MVHPDLEAFFLAQSPLHDFEKTFFYSDSVNDIPLLESVTDPIATNPDDILHKHAEKPGWRIIYIFGNA